MNKHGITFTISDNKQSGGRIWRAVTAFLLFLAGINALADMLGFAAPPLSFPFGNAWDGILLLCNRLFAASEQRQLYVYNMLAVTLPESEYAAAMGAAFVLLAVLWAALCTLLAWKPRGWLLGLCAAAAAGAQVYFGVFPSALWNILLFGSFSLLVLPKGKTTAAICLCAAAALSAGLSLTLFPGPSAALYNSSEAVRDWFGETVENPAAQAVRQAEVQRQAQRREEERRTESVRAENEAGQAAALRHEDAFAGAQAGSLSPRAPWIAPVTAAVLAVLLAACVAHALRRAARRRALLSSPDARAAIQRQFALCVDCLAVRGLPVRNAVYAAYAVDVAARFPALAEAYAGAAALWRECVYSKHEITEAHRAQMKAFTDMARADEARERTFTRLRLAMLRFNGGAGE